MNLLFLTSRIPFPPNRGDKVRTFFFLKELCRIHNVTLISLVEIEDEKEYKTELDKYCNEVILIHKSKLQHLVRFACGLINRIPFQVNYYNFPSLREEVKTIVKKNKIDLVYTHLIRMAPIVQDLKIRKILDYTDAISMEYKRSLPHRKSVLAKLFYAWEAKRTRRYEQIIINRFDEGWFISDEDILNLNLQSNKKIKLVPNPVNMGILKNEYTLKKRLLFVGNMSVAHNISAVQFITNKLMPEIIKKYQIEFHIIGAHPNEEVMALDGLHNTKIIGFVDDLYAELIKSDIFLAPMFFSAGVQNKVLEAMAVGLPVITTDNVVRSIMATNGVNVVCCDTEREFVNSSLDLLKNMEKRKKIGEAGYDLMKSTFSLEHIRNILEETK